jgi:UDP-glucose 4-epimerase
MNVIGTMNLLAAENPTTSVAVLRLADVIGLDASNPITRNLSRRFSPCLLGFDPLVQFVDQTDAVRALAHATAHGLRGIFNVAGDGVQPFSEVAARCGTRLVPVPPVKPATAVAPLARLGLLELPPELVRLLRYGRAVNNAKLVRTGFEYRYTSPQAVERFGLSVRDARRAPLSTVPPTDPAAPPGGSPIPPR